ncbi:OsmC family protein [Aquibium sp. A9E412]|uniref:OsmC family protein n=1 Tax=Aquibium sp. A9E412 TaxID=2976767 RepID=UPI0025B183CD|nr:OsmC family protein [Aquibium sp. A9E412]MDN2567049.1 OsmC family protein [Aquibium sp. A9E412]
MALKFKPKTYGPFSTRFAEDGSVTVATAPQQTVALASPPTAEAGSPVDFLLAALASCLAISLAYAARQMALDTGEITVSAGASKAEDPPARLAGYTIEVGFEKTPGEEACAQLLARGKALCTVSNSLAAPVTLTVRA